MKTILALFCLIMCGCSSVVLNKPFPETLLLPEEQEQLSGTWVHDSTVGHVRFTSNGIPWMAGIEWKNDDFTLAKSRLYFTRHNSTLYVCMPVEPDQSDRYLFGEIKVDNNKAYVWGPDVVFFAEQVEKGVLSGTVERNRHSVSVSLETPAEALLELVSTNHLAVDYKNPIILRKLD